MSKELLKARQYRHVDAGALQETSLSVTPEQAQDLAALYGSTFEQFKVGGIVEGLVLEKTADGVLVDINYKSDGLIPLYEFNEVELKKIDKGSKLEVIIEELENVNGDVVISYERAKAAKAWASIMKLFEEGKPVEGVVLSKVKGGLSVDIGVPAFLPGSQVDVQRVMDFDQFVGQTITAYIIKVNQKRGNVIISRRKYLNEQRSEVRKGILETLSEGQVLQGVVKNITNYGVFIDIGGVDGLLHITDMTWGRIAHPSEIVKIGDSVTVKVLSFDKEHEKISLGMKQLSSNPWEALSESVQVGSTVKGTISSITDYGLFVEVSKGVEGLVHISEISWTDRITDLHKHYKVGQSIEALVVSLDKENRRMSLSIKQLERNPWDEVCDSFEVGQEVQGKISNIIDAGIFVQLAPGVDGFVRVGDISWTEHVKHPSDLYEKGQEIEAVILNINKQKRHISLGIKQLTENPWENLVEKYPIGSTVSGEVTKITDFGAFVRLESGIEALVHISELSGDNVAKVEDVLHVGDSHDFRVIKVNQDEQKLGLSLKPESARRPRPQGGKDAKPRRDRSVSSENATASGPKGKSQLQLELEKLRGDND